MSFQIQVGLHHVVQHLLQHVKTAPNATQSLWLLLIPAPVELQVRPPQAFLPQHSDRWHRNSPAQTCSTETPLKIPELLLTHKAVGPLTLGEEPLGQPGPASGLSPAKATTGVKSTAHEGQQL